MGPDFSGAFARQNNLLTRFDPRVKLALILIALAGVLLTKNLLLPLILFFVPLGFLTLLGASVRLLMLRIGFALIIAVSIFTTQLFLFGQTPMFTWLAGPFTLTIYQEGIGHGLLLALRVMAGISLLLLLTLTTTMDKLISSLKWFKVPLPLIEMMTIAYHYIFIFWEEMGRVRKAQRIRLGYKDWRKGLQAVASLGGILLLRAFDRSEKLYRSMLGRGYRGSFEVTSQGELASGNGKSSLALGVIIVIFIILAI